MALSEADKANGMIEVEVFVFVDENEVVFASDDYDHLKERMADCGAELCGRLVRVTIKLPAPAPIEVDVELGPESSECKVSVK